MDLENIKQQTTWNDAAEGINSNFAKVDIEIEKLKNVTTRDKGYYQTVESLTAAHPTASVGSRAFIGYTPPYAVWVWDKDSASWVNSGESFSDGQMTVDSEMSDTSVNPVQNKIIKAYVDSVDSLLQEEINTKAEARIIHVNTSSANEQIAEQKAYNADTYKKIVAGEKLYLLYPVDAGYWMLTPIANSNGIISLERSTTDGFSAYVTTVQLSEDGTTTVSMEIRAFPTYQIDSEMSDISGGLVPNKIIKAYVDAVKAELDAIVGGDATDAIDSINEILAFLSTMADSDTLAGIVANLKKMIQKGDDGNIRYTNEAIAALKQYLDDADNDLDEKIGNLAEHIDNLETSASKVVIFDATCSTDPWSLDVLQTETTVEEIVNAINNGSPIYMRFGSGLVAVDNAELYQNGDVSLYVHLVDSESELIRTIHAYSTTDGGWEWESFDNPMGGSVSPDEEDITTNEEGKLQFKDRGNADGMGYVILRKGKALSEQIVNADTIYEVRYDFALDTDFSMPENCTLRFNGGSLSGAYTLTLNATYIEADDEQIFGDDLSVVGTPANNEGLAEWFGAKGLYGKGKYVGGDTASLVDGVDALPDSAVAINKSLSIFGITSLGAGKTYRTATTISVPFQKTLNNPKDTIIVPFMSGEGLVIKTVNKETSAYDEDVTLTEKPLTMLENQFIATDNMAVAITMAARSVLSGGGTIFLGKSDFTIGILIPGYAYDYNDMAWSHRIDTRIIGGPKASCWSPDVRDIIGDVAPTADIGVDGQYYYNEATGTYYVKSSGAWSVKSSNYGERNRFNTSIRFYIPSGKRLINPIIDVWDMYGYRGIELITEGDGWFNESIIKGTVSNKHGSFISIFTGGGGASIHHWDDITMQVGKDIGHDARMFFASKCQHVDLGMVWDLAWFRPPRVVTAFELCRNTADVTLPFVDEITFVKDDGAWNKYIHHPKMTDEQSIVPLMYENALKYMSPTFKGQMVSSVGNSIFEELTKPYTLSELRAKEYTMGGIAPKCIFDGDNSSYYRAIDVDNGKYGCVLLLNNRNPNSQIKTRHYQAWLEVDYRPNVYKGDNGCYMSLASTEEPIQTIGLDHFYESSATWSNDMTLKKFFRIRGGARSHITTLYIHATADAPAGTTVDIVGVKLWMDSNNVNINRNILGGVEKNRPDAMPKGALFFNEDTGHAEVNKGTSDTPLWEDVAADKMMQLKLIAHSSSDAVAKVAAGEYHRWESATSVFVIPTGFNNALAYVQFKASDSGCELSFPRDVAVNAYTITGGKTYMVTVLGMTAAVHEMSLLGYPEGAVRFEDPYTEYLCVKMYGAEGYVTEAQLANVTSLSGFSGTDIESFDELNLFTGLTSIPANAFQNCQNLRYISFGSKVESIGDNVFRWAYISGASDGVQRLRVYAAEPPALSSTQQFFPAVIEVPAICLEAYKTAPVWSNYADRMIPIDGYTPPVQDELIMYDTLTLADSAEILLADILFADNEFELDCTLGGSGTTMVHGIAADGTTYNLYRSKNGSYKGASNGATSDTQFYLSSLAHVVAWKADGVYMDGTLTVTQARTAQEWQIRLRGGNNIVRSLDVFSASGGIIHSLRPATFNGIPGLWDSVTKKLYGQTSDVGTVTVS